MFDTSGYEVKLEAREWGKFAENIAAEYLLSEGYTIRERNWRVGHTIEVDIIAEKGNDMVFVEVKARSGNWEDAADAVDLKKMRKISKGADIYLRAAPFNYDYRFDIITVTGNVNDYKLEHYPDAFMPPLKTR